MRILIALVLALVILVPSLAGSAGAEVTSRV